MNKFQRIAYQIAKCDFNSWMQPETHFDITMYQLYKAYYYDLKHYKSSWPYQKCLDFKNNYIKKGKTWI